MTLKPLPKTEKFLWLKRIILVMLLSFFLLAPIIISRSSLNLAYLILYVILLAESWNLLSGYSGYVNFGFVLYIGIGMYVSALLLPILLFPIVFLLGGIISAMVAFLFSYPLLRRLRGAYFSIATLALAEAIRVLAGSKFLDFLTMGASGITTPALVRLPMIYYSMLTITILCILVVYKIGTSHFGLKLLSIREDEEKASTLGIDTLKVKTITFILSAFFGGLAGSTHFAFIHYVDPSIAFDSRFTVMAIVTSILGGIGTVFGPVIGGIIIGVMDELIWSHFSTINIAALGLLLVILAKLMPQGIIGLLTNRGVIINSRTN